MVNQEQFDLQGVLSSYPRLECPWSPQNEQIMNYLGLTDAKVTAVTKQLNTLLSCYHVYYQNLRNFHWNVEGSNFFELHEKFEQMYDDAKLKIDEIAERILTLRQRPVSNFSEYLELSKVKEAGKVIADDKMIEVLLENHKVLISHMRELLKVADESEDEGTIDMIGGFLSELEKASWMLDAWVARTKRKTATE